MNRTEFKQWTIRDIESISEITAATLAEEKAVIKEHDIYFIDFPGYFGYSCVVFRDGHHIHYANDYALHHRDKTKNELREMYESSLNGKLFTEQELAEPLKSYSEYRAKSNFLQNYYGMRRDYLSMFRIIHNDAEEKEYEREKKKYPVVDPVSYAYYREQDRDFVRRHVELVAQLEQAMDATKNDYDYQKSAFYYEMGNHEYHINYYQADWDTLSAFGKIEWHGDGAAAREKYFDELDFNEIQRKAYMDARRDFLRDAEEKGWY